MQGFEVSENRCLTPFGKDTPNSQTDSQTPVRHLPFYGNENRDLLVSDRVSEGVCQLLNCHCLSGGVSLGRATPDTPDTRDEKEVRK